MTATCTFWCQFGLSIGLSLSLHSHPSLPIEFGAMLLCCLALFTDTTWDATAWDVSDCTAGAWHLMQDHIQIIFLGLVDCQLGVVMHTSSWHIALVRGVLLGKHMLRSINNLIQRHCMVMLTLLGHVILTTFARGLPAGIDRECIM